MSASRQAIAVIAAALFAAMSCGRGGLQPGEGYVQVPGGRVWYRIVGHGTRTPLLVLHGGPGVPSTYLKPLAALADERPVVFYDQLGSGKSDHPRDTTLWRMERFQAELAAVRESLGLGEVHLYGHSWGTMLAVDYLLLRPRGVRSVVLSGPVLDYARTLRDDDSLKRTLPDSIVRVLIRHERDGSCDSPEYQAAMMSYYARFFVRRQPLSADLDSAMRGADPIPDETVFGRCGRGGPLATYDRTAQLGSITIPALFVVGGFDMTTPAAARAYQRQLPGSEIAIFDSSGHLPMQDEPQRYVTVIREFLRRVEGR